VQNTQLVAACRWDKNIRPAPPCQSHSWQFLKTALILGGVMAEQAHSLSSVVSWRYFLTPKRRRSHRSLPSLSLLMLVVNRADAAYSGTFLPVKGG
jgi:hypothetical protein